MESVSPIKHPYQALANTFEDALVYENPQLFTGLTGHGLIAKFREALTDAPDLGALAERIRTALKSGDKAEFALDLLYSEEIKDLRTHAYIHEGLEWLTIQLKRKERDTVGNPEGGAT
jgi:hypothetical protein